MKIFFHQKGGDYSDLKQMDCNAPETCPSARMMDSIFAANHFVNAAELNFKHINMNINPEKRAAFLANIAVDSIFYFCELPPMHATNFVSFNLTTDSFYTPAFTDVLKKYSGLTFDVISSTFKSSVGNDPCVPVGTSTVLFPGVSFAAMAAGTQSGFSGAVFQHFTQPEERLLLGIHIKSMPNVQMKAPNGAGTFVDNGLPSMTDLGLTFGINLTAIDMTTRNAIVTGA